MYKAASFISQILNVNLTAKNLLINLCEIHIHELMILFSLSDVHSVYGAISTLQILYVTVLDTDIDN